MPGTGDVARVEVAEALAYLGDRTTFEILISMRHEPIASAVYLQNMGTTEEDDSLLDRDAKESNAFPMNE